MLISLIVAMDEKGGIGIGNRLPWRLPADLKRFKTLTMDHHLIVGRKTFESIGHSLPGRKMVVVSRSLAYSGRSQVISYAHSLDEALSIAAERGETEAFIGGGAEIYTQAMAYADRIYLTLVHTVVRADVFFPPIDESAWIVQETIECSADEKNQYPFTHRVLARR